MRARLAFVWLVGLLGLGLSLSAPAMQFNQGWQDQGEVLDDPGYWSVAVVRRDDGTYVMYAEEPEGGDPNFHENIAAFTSSEGLSFQVQTDPLIVGESKPDGLTYSFRDPSVLLVDGSTLMMWYRLGPGMSAGDYSGIFLATKPLDDLSQ